MQLREWQSACIQQALERYRTGKEHFLCLATPGAGKTVMASVLADRLLKTGKVDMVMCFSPSVVVADDFKIELEQITGKVMDGLLGSVGSSLTYQSMRSLTSRFWALFEQHRIFVIFDEIHHCAGMGMELANAWGEKIITHIQGRATYTLALTGTPWRSDQLPIVLARYCDEKQQVRCDYSYGLAQAITDRVCRAPVFTVIDNDLVQFECSGESKRYQSFQALLEGSDCSYQELLESRDLILYCLTKANLKLDQLRRKNPSAGGLIVTTSIAHANQIHQLLTAEFCEQADIVTHKEEDALAIIRDFKHTQRKWIISVGMISEGTNIPRLQVCCHLTRVKTELYFRQILGRILRDQGQANECGYLFMPAEPTLVEYAQRITKDIPDASVIKLGPAINPKFSIIDSAPPATRYRAPRQDGGVTLGKAVGGPLIEPVRAAQRTRQVKKSSYTLGRSLLSSNYMSELNISGRFIYRRLSIGANIK